MIPGLVGDASILRVLPDKGRLEPEMKADRRTFRPRAVPMFLRISTDSAGVSRISGRAAKASQL